MPGMIDASWWEYFANQILWFIVQFEFLVMFHEKILVFPSYLQINGNDFYGRRVKTLSFFNVIQQLSFWYCGIHKKILENNLL